MELSDYKPTCQLDFEILLDKWVESEKSNMPIDPNFDKEEYLKELMIESFKMGLSAGKMAVNRKII